MGILEPSCLPSFIAFLLATDKSTLSYNSNLEQVSATDNATFTALPLPGKVTRRQGLGGSSTPGAVQDSGVNVAIGEGSCCAVLSLQGEQHLRRLVTDSRVRVPGGGFWGAVADLPQRS